MTDELTGSITLTATTGSQSVTELPDTYTNTHSNTSPYYTPHTTPTTHTQTDHNSSEEDDNESDEDSLQSSASNTSKPVTHTPAHTTTNYLSGIAKPYVSPPLHIITEEKSNESPEEREMTVSARETEEHSTQTNQSPYIVPMTTSTKITTNQNSHPKTTLPTATYKNTVVASTLVQLPFMKGSGEKEILFEDIEKSEEDKETGKSQESSAEQPGYLSTTKPATQTQLNTKPSLSKEDERHKKDSREDLQSDEEADESVTTQTTVIPSRVKEVSPSMWFPRPHSVSPRPTAHTSAKPTKNHKTTSAVPPHKPVSTRTTTSGYASVETAPHPQKPPRPALDRSPSLTTTAQQESAEEEEQEKEEENTPSDSSQESEKIGNVDNSQ